MRRQRILALTCSRFTLGRGRRCLSVKARDSVEAWEVLQTEAKNLMASSSKLAGFGIHRVVKDSIVAHSTLADALSSTLGRRLGNSIMDFEGVATIAYEEDPQLVDAAAKDLSRWIVLDPAAGGMLRVFLFFKGFHSVQCARVAHHFWNRPARDSRFIASALQSEMSNVFGVDIHPGSKWGSGITMDHGGGCVVGETSVIGDNVYLMHNVTLGATGTSNNFDRHPKIGRGAFLAASCTVLGNVEVGAGAVVGACSLVNKPVPPGYTAMGVPAKFFPPREGQPKTAPSGTPLPDDDYIMIGEGL